MVSSPEPEVFLYGSYASYATAKTRCYLRKKGIPFVERLPAHPRFREHVRPNSNNHRIPQIELKDGTVVQDTVAIVDALEALFPEPSIFPPGPRQGLVARLFEQLLDELLMRAAWHYRWNYMDENYRFVGREFGRSFKPQGTDEELEHYGRVIADRMEAKRAGIGATDEALPIFETFYVEALDILETHFTTTPYLFGGRPSIADFSLMGSLFGHLARDPVPASIMKTHAPRVFRWTEAMNTPEIQSPEFAEFPTEFDAQDELPNTIRDLMKLALEASMDRLPRSADMYNEWVRTQNDVAAGTPVSEKHDEPAVGQFEASLRGVTMNVGASLYPLWVHQRTLNWFKSLPAEDQKAGRELLASVGGERLVDLELERPLTRANSFIALG